MEIKRSQTRLLFQIKEKYSSLQHSHMNVCECLRPQRNKFGHKTRNYMSSQTLNLQPRNTKDKKEREKKKIEQLRFKLLLRPSSNLNLVLKHYLTSAVFLETFDVELTDGHTLPWCRQQGLQDAASRGEHHLMPSSELVIRFFGFHQDMSLHDEVLTAMSSTRKMMPITPSSPTKVRLSSENLHTNKQSTASAGPVTPPESLQDIRQDPTEGGIWKQAPMAATTGAKKTYPP